MSRYRPLPVLTLMCGLSVLLLAAAEGKQKAQVSSTERKDFPPNGTLRFTNSIGVLTVEAWERPEVEITAIKSTKAEYEARDREKAANMLARFMWRPSGVAMSWSSPRIFPGSVSFAGWPRRALSVWSTASRRQAPHD